MKSYYFISCRIETQSRVFFKSKALAVDGKITKKFIIDHFERILGVQVLDILLYSYPQKMDKKELEDFYTFTEDTDGK